ncbi:pyridoxal-phosphate dependent enzyme [Altererythrobacter aerius]|uniref:L-cysteine desulfhydrase Cds1 n=1 Tax=Tsuneonella aeria TaxID=1837929 RepID=A0A6I4TBX4_9SPHN|nr:PLP-dependent cysteine synthase family protein [Tsuneonella aeria]MXO74254.1 pyridoxal-phosphate dependent enzyme [Tsuneonella aeria]
MTAGRFPADRAWTAEAIRAIEADYNRSADTHLVPVPLPAMPGVHLYLKDEASHPTGSLKHRLARSLFLYALCDGRIGPGKPVVEASSGSTAVSEAYFARMLGLPFYAVVPRSTAPAKVAAIEFYGGTAHFVDDPAAVYAVAQQIADDMGGVYLDQFTFAERATDWRGNNNIAETIFEQLALEPHPVPAWIVCGAGTGGTSATIGRFIRFRRHATRLMVADPAASVFHRHWADRSITTAPGCGSCIEGIGRPRVEASFLPDVVDAMVAVEDAQSVAGARLLSRRIGRKVGGSTGTNLWAVAILAQEMADRGESGSIVTILCDDGERYAGTYFDDAWVAGCGLDLAGPTEKLARTFGWPAD